MRRLVSLFLLLFPLAVSAETVTVRSGEHPGYSRLTLEFENFPEWAMGRTDERYVLRIDQDGFEPDLSSVFQRLSADRISDLSFRPDAQQLRIDLNCNCYARAFKHSDRWLVVDILDGPAPESARYETPLAEKAFEQTNSRVGSQMTQTRGQQTTPAQHVIPMAATRRTERMDHNLTNFPNLGAADETPNASNNAHSNLTQPEQEQGLRLLEIDTIENDNLATQWSFPPTLENGFQNFRNEAVNLAQQMNAHINVATEPNTENERNVAQKPTPPTDLVTECLDDSLFDLANWGMEEGISNSIFAARGSFMSEFDIVTPEAAERLTRSYIYATFGAEAESVLNTFGQELEHADLLRALAQIVDNGYAKDSTSLGAQIGCPNSSALWAVLAQQQILEKNLLNKEAILQTFSELPLHLRRHLGPVLSQRLLDIGETSVAQSVLNAVARAPGNHGAPFEVAEAKLELTRDNNNIAEETLEKIVATNDAATPDALLSLIRSRLARGLEIDPQIIATTEALAFEHQGTQMGAHLSRALILAQGQNGSFDAALDGLTTLSEEQGNDAETTAMWDHVTKNLVSLTDDTSFLEIVFRHQKPLTLAPLNPELRRALTRRAVDHGFTGLARTLLNAPDHPAGADRIILASAALADQKPGLAIDLVRDVNDPEAIHLKVRAHTILGHLREAAELAALTEDLAAQKEALWRAGSWSQLESIGSEAQQKAAKLMLEHSGGVTDPAPRPDFENQGALLRGNALLEQSRAARNTVQAVLSDYDLPPPDTR